jgi:hypothetical protein
MHLAYLSYIFSRLKTLNTSLQGGNNNNIIEPCDKLKAFIRKVELWHSKMENSNVDMFLDSSYLSRKLGLGSAHGF